MSSAAVQRDLLMPRPADAVGGGLVLALLVHALLIAALALGVNWHTSDSNGIEAELWAAVPQVAAPRLNDPTPAPPVKPPEPPPRPEPKSAPQPDAQIAIEKARREEAKREQAQRDEAERKKKEQADKEEAKRRKKEKDLAAKKELADKQKRDEATLDAQRAANLKRMMGQAGATGDENAKGRALQDAAPSAGYAGRVRARIQPNIKFPDNLDGNPLATVEVRVSPSGTIIGRKLVKSSGVPAWDDAVLRAIDNTEKLPTDTDGRIPPSFLIEFKRYE